MFSKLPILYVCKQTVTVRADRGCCICGIMRVPCMYIFEYDDGVECPLTEEQHALALVEEEAEYQVSPDHTNHCIHLVLYGCVWVSSDMRARIRYVGKCQSCMV